MNTLIASLISAAMLTAPASKMDRSFGEFNIKDHFVQRYDARQKVYLYGMGE